MNTNLLYKNEVYSIIGSSMEILNTLGCGLQEKVYENSLVVDFKLKNISCEQQKRFPVFYKKHEVGTFIPDLIAYGKIVIDAKVIPKITDSDRGQILNYLKLTKLKLGLIINFKNPTLEYERVILDNKPLSLY